MSLAPAGEQGVPQPSELRSAGWLAAGCAAFCALLALACLASVAVVANRPAAQLALLQPVILDAGSFELSAAISGTPDCPPEIQDCSVPIMPGQVYGSVWFSTITHQQTLVTMSFKPLLRVRLR